MARKIAPPTTVSQRNLAARARSTAAVATAAAIVALLVISTKVIRPISPRLKTSSTGGQSGAIMRA